MVHSGVKKVGQVLRWNIILYIFTDNKLNYPVLNWECYTGERLQVGLIQAAPNSGVIFKSEFNDTPIQLHNLEQTEAILFKFGLEKPPFVEEAIEDLFILQTKILSTLEMAVYEYNRLCRKWEWYTTKVYH